MISITLDGADRLAAKLARLPAEATARVDAAVEATAVRVQARARENAPKDTGTLARSISVRNVGPMHREVFTNVVYALRMEFGFVGADRRGRVYNQPGRFYMTRAADESRAGFHSQVGRAVAAALPED